MGISLKAPAKINLGLRITGRREDGYHELDSFFCLLEEPFDILEISLREEPGLILECHGAELDPDKNSLSLSYRAFQKLGFALPGLYVRLVKGIPLGAGLGGGSSDAACLLKFLNTKLAQPLAQEPLQKLALGIGADVPFFLQNSAARVRGIGEKISACSCTFLPCWLLLVTPGLQINTAWAYGEYDRRKELGESGPQALTKAEFASMVSLLLPGKDQDEIPQKLSWTLDNALELPVMPKYPELAQLKSRLGGLGAAAVAMSGSGSSLYAIFSPEEEGLARHALHELESQGLPSYLQYLGRPA